MPATVPLGNMAVVVDSAVPAAHPLVIVEYCSGVSTITVPGALLLAGIVVVDSIRPVYPLVTVVY